MGGHFIHNVTRLCPSTQIQNQPLLVTLCYKVTRWGLPLKTGRQKWWFTYIGRCFRSIYTHTSMRFGSVYDLCRIVIEYTYAEKQCQKIFSNYFWKNQTWRPSRVSIYRSEQEVLGAISEKEGKMDIARMISWNGRIYAWIQDSRYASCKANTNAHGKD